MWDGVLNFLIEGSLQNFFRRTKRIQDSNGFIAMVLVQNFSFNKGTCVSTAKPKYHFFHMVRIQILKSNDFSYKDDE
jgi:hypothetical protein